MPSRPNILWIVTTQWRAQACGYAGDPNAVTPAIDALAAEGVNHAQAVTPHPFGPWARAALLTGTPSPENGVRDYFDPLPSGARTIAHRMEARGYATAYFGKWHLARRDPAAALVGEAHARTVVPEGERGGFGHWEGFEGGFLLNDPLLHGTCLPEPTRFPGYQSDVVGGRAADWLARAHGPWFAVVSLEAPHPPYGAPSAGVVPAEPSAIVLAPNVPPSAADRARWELAGYHAHLTATDRAIGRLVEAVGAGDTIVVFTSVHGDMHGAHGLFRKGWPHEESVRVPLLVRRPGRAAARSDAPVSLLDLAGWTVAWAEGREPVLPEEPCRISMPSVVRLPDQCDRTWTGWRDRRRKLVLGPDGAPWLFFDLEKDPGEQRNLVTDPGWAGEIRAWAARFGAGPARG